MFPEWYWHYCQSWSKLQFHPFSHATLSRLPCGFLRAIGINASTRSAAERFLALWCVSWTGSPCVSPGVTVRCVWFHPWTASGPRFVYIYTLGILADLATQVASATHPSNAVCIVLFGSLSAVWSSWLSLSSSPGGYCSVCRSVASLVSSHGHYNKRSFPRHQSLDYSWLLTVSPVVSGCHPVCSWPSMIADISLQLFCYYSAIQTWYSADARF